VLTKQVSRGTVYFNTSDIYTDPLIDYRTFTNPTDFDVMVENFRFIRRWLDSATSREIYAPIEVKPGADFATDEALIEVIKGTSSSSAAHLVCPSPSLFL
jgi:choline dehydrogenase